MLLATEADPGDQPALTVEDGSFLTYVSELGLEKTAAFVANLDVEKQGAGHRHGLAIAHGICSDRIANEATSLQRCTSCKTHQSN